MSENREEKNLDKAQGNQNKVGDAAANPETTGPAENLREKAAQANNKNEESREPA
jgi:hypothetical protein